MAFVTIPSNAIDVGDPITKDLWDKVKENLDDLNSRTTSVEASQNQILIWSDQVLNAATITTGTGIDSYKAPFNLTITDASVQIYEKGLLTGAIEIDFKVNTTPDDTGMTSIFTTRPKVTLAGASDYDTSTNQVLDATKTSIAAGSFIRFDVTEFPTGGVLGQFYIVLKAEVA